MKTNSPIGRHARQPIAIEMILNPPVAMNRVKETRSWLVGIALLLCIFLIGSYLQRGAVHNIEAIYQQLSYQQDPQGLSAAQQQAAVEGVRHAALLHDLPNWLFAFTFIVAAIALAWGFALLITSLGGGEPHASTIWAALINIAVPTIGLFSVISGVIAVTQPSPSFVTYHDIIGLVPSALNLSPQIQSEFWRSFLASVNPFSIWAGILYFIMFAKLCDVGVRLSATAAVVLVISGSFLQGILGAVST